MENFCFGKNEFSDHELYEFRKPTREFFFAKIFKYTPFTRTVSNIKQMKQNIFEICNFERESADEDVALHSQ